MMTAGAKATLREAGTASALPSGMSRVPGMAGDAKSTHSTATTDSDGSNLMDIQRKLVEKRFSKISIYNGVAYFAATPDRPFDTSDSILPQARQILARVEERLAEVGSTKADLLFVTIILSDKCYLAEFNELWDEWVSDITPPSRACFFAELTNPDMKVEFVMHARARQ
jgi:enamine deaminase RidA (YjgF/YER057c/UK114 family)